uniref:Uncharacterized protein n=1 Tax=Ditylenchus dipsaci TaxID=166011 RepID=A0A915CTN9_9BILA
MLLENAKETEMVICNFEGCRTIFAKTGCGGLRLLGSSALATAAMEAFQRKVGDFSTNWLASGGNLNKELVVCAAFMDPFVHLQLENVCEKIPGLDYGQLKTVVLEKASQISPEEACDQPPSRRASFFQSNKPTVVEQEFKAYSVMWHEDPLILEIKCKVHASSCSACKMGTVCTSIKSASERAFKELRCVLGDFARNRLNPNRTASSFS